MRMLVANKANSRILGRGTGPLTGLGGFATPVFNALDSENLILIGASLTDRGLSSAGEQAWVAEVATHLGFNNVTERATEGHTFANTIAALPAILDEFAATAHQNTYFMHRSGNDVTNNRPYGAAEHDGFLNNLKTIRDLIRARGSKFIFGNITYRPYDSAPAINPHSGADTDGSGPYNTEVVEPFIELYNSDWWDPITSKPVVDLYGFTRDNLGLISSDRVHLVNAQEDIFFEFIMTKIADHASSAAPTNMAGRSIFLNAVTGGNHRVRTGNMNWHSWFTGKVVDMAGVACTGVSIEWRGWSATTSNGAGTGAEARIADTRFHGLDASVLVQQTFIASVANLDKTRQTWGEIRVHGLQPEATGTLTMVGTRAGVTEAGGQRRITVTTDGGATTGTLNAVTDAASNQVVLAFEVPADGTLVIRGDIGGSSIFGHFDAAILDFD